tara:strand:- start:519 stop:644 length:126 start_codon:yes stop_codon:yes gene_type:complete
LSKLKSSLIERRFLSEEEAASIERDLAEAHEEGASATPGRP